MYFSIDPSALRLLLKTHFVPIVLCPLDNLVARNTPRSLIESSSAQVGLRQCTWSGPPTTSSNVDGSEKFTAASKAFALACHKEGGVGVYSVDFLNSFLHRHYLDVKSVRTVSLPFPIRVVGALLGVYLRRYFRDGVRNFAFLFV